ncbi:hypothetical protein [Bombella mellum]|uniref:hypothetical protein n=1 Tax=Bombella mellum TaxID=2039288 RepID=UPI0015F71B8C|nr:hypothetical protein [Bombella mellum]
MPKKKYDPKNYSLDPNDYEHPPAEKLSYLKESVYSLIGVQLPILQLPKDTLETFEPSQIGTIVGTLVDASIPQLDKIIRNEDPGGSEQAERFAHGLSKADGILGEREGYPDYEHKQSGLRIELKLLYVNPDENISMKTPPTPREPSARLSQKVTLKNVKTDKDVLLVIAYKLQERRDNPDFVSPAIIDVEAFPVIDCVLARDKRLLTSGGKWHGNFETPVIRSKAGLEKLRNEIPLDENTYGRKESEGKDFNEDTNFGKLKRIPYKPLSDFLNKHKK